MKIRILPAVLFLGANYFYAESVCATDTRMFAAGVSSAALTGDISESKVFPNPFRPAQGHKEIKFRNLPPGASVKIYTLLGQLVRELTADISGRANWDAKNSAGSNVAADVYLAYIEGGSGRKILKVGIRR